MPDILNNVTVTANNETVLFIPESVTYDEGLGEYTMTALSGGGGRTVTAFATDQTTALSGLKFDLPPTIDAIAQARSWKVNRNRNVFTLTASNEDGTFTRTFQQAAVVNNYENEMSKDGKVPIEIMGNPAV